MNKTHWNTVDPVADVPSDAVLEMIEDAYDIVFHALPKRLRNALLQ